MANYFDHYENAANEILNQVGKNIVIGIPLGLGKPVGIINALYRLASSDTSIHLTICTGLTFARPALNNILEKRLVEPILNRVLGDYEELLYEKDRVSQQIPENITVIEFFLLPGKFLNNTYVQQHYVSSCYTNVVRDISTLSINVLAQLVAPSRDDSNLFSLSCNTDLFHETRAHLKKIENEGKKIAIVAELNSNLPYMYGDVAEVDSNLFTVVINPVNHHSIFAVPRDKLSVQDHLIGLYASSLIVDNGCLQIGIGQLSNALANALIFRHKENQLYRELMNKINVCAKSENSLSPFDVGLYGSTEMLSDEFIQLYKAGVLKKRVYDHIGLQKLLNANLISENVTPDFIDILIAHQIINTVFTSADLLFLTKFGIFKDGITLNDNDLILPSGESIPIDNKEQIQKKCLGEKLKSGKVIHAGFFFGSVDFYSQLRTLPYNELSQIDMTSIARTNSLLWSPELLKLQRLNARFVNSSLMVNLLGGVISDSLKNYQELSGVGGQYDFVSMSNQIHDARSIIVCRSTRKTKNGTQSNIMWDYPNTTLPRYLRDFVVTEYGIADCRGKTDADVIKSMLNITDSRFQQTLLNIAKKSGKISQDYSIPKSFLNNTPQFIQSLIKTKALKNHFKPYPFGSDLTPDEEIIADALLYLKNCNRIKLTCFIFISLFFFKSDKSYFVYLQRMQLMQVKTIKEFLYKKIFKLILYYQTKKNTVSHNEG
jgi:acyl-CoA hydrolase